CMFGEQSFNEYLFIILVSLMCIFHGGKFTLQKAGIVLICTVTYLSQEASQQRQMSAMCLCGGSASGKTTVANKIIEALDVPWVVLNKEEQELAARHEYNFDHPDAFDFELLITVLRKLKKGKSIKVPVYDFTSHSRRKEWVRKLKLSLAFLGFQATLLDMKVFVDTDSDIRLIRRLKRDVSQRGRDINGIIKQYNKFVKPAFEQYIEPTVQVADIVVPRG
ncbi:hypothetical protein XENOCAPTIV_002101, partial [Xenoophorus captivus]